MITKNFYQKYLPVLFYYPPELVLRQYKNMSNFFIFGVFQMLYTLRVLNVIKAGFHTSRLICFHNMIVHPWENLSGVMRKPAFCICKNKGADQRLCFHYIDSTIPILSSIEVSSL